MLEKKEIKIIIKSQSNMGFKLQEGERKHRNLRLSLLACQLNILKFSRFPFFFFF